jgi:hypothetical protein
MLSSIKAWWWCCQVSKSPLVAAAALELFSENFPCPPLELLEEARDMKQSSDAKATQLQNELDTAQFKCTKINEESEVLRGHIQVRKTSDFFDQISCINRNFLSRRRKATKFFSPRSEKI